MLGRLSGKLCNTVTGRPGSQALLEQVERAGLFLVPLDEVRGPGTVNLVRIRVIPDRIDPPTGASQRWHRRCPRRDGLLAMGPGARLVGGRRVSNGGRLPTWICFTGCLLPGSRGAGYWLPAAQARSAGLRRWSRCSYRVVAPAWQASASWLMFLSAGAGTMGVWRSASSWTLVSGTPFIRHISLGRSPECPNAPIVVRLS